MRQWATRSIRLPTQQGGGVGCVILPHRSCATGANSVSSRPPQQAATSPSDIALTALRARIQSLYPQAPLRLDGARIAPRYVGGEFNCGRGLFATRSFREGEPILSVPMSLTLSREHIFASYPSLKDECLSRDSILVICSSHGVKDPLVVDFLQLAMLLTALRLFISQTGELRVKELLTEAAKMRNKGTSGQEQDLEASSILIPQSPWESYFLMLPRCAIDDDEVIRKYKDILNPHSLVEWGQTRIIYTAMCNEVHKQWTQKLCTRHAASTLGNIFSTFLVPQSLLWWSFRTILARQIMLPVRGLSSTAVGSSLHYSALATFVQSVASDRFLPYPLRRMKKALFPGKTGADFDDFTLMPTLVPLIDCIGHLTSSNVSVEVVERPVVGPCCEVQAITSIAQSEELGMKFGSAQSPAFTLFRQGFLPI